MLTPGFKLSQDENRVFITIHAPYTNIADTEVEVDGQNFVFVSSPYFLRLQLPGHIVEDESSTGDYVCEDGDFNLSFKKVHPGEYFENLNMITSLLAPREIPNLNPDLIQELESSPSFGDGEQATASENINQQSSTEISENITGYGFANKLTANFSHITSEFPQLFSNNVPITANQNERNELRCAEENEKFSSDHYLADFYETDILEPVFQVPTFWQDWPSEKITTFTSEEIGVLKELPNKSYLLSKTEKDNVWMGLVDLLFAYCYDKRSTLNESTVESSWTINHISSTLNCFACFENLEQTLIAGYRRALIYPIYRNFDLCVCVQKDLSQLLLQGKVFIIKCLIDIYQIFNTSQEGRYILNQIYIKDYLIFMQKCHDNEFVDLQRKVHEIKITKAMLDLELEELEEAADIIQKEEENGNSDLKQCTNRLAKIGLSKSASYRLHDSDDDSSSEYTSSDCETDSQTSSDSGTSSDSDTYSNAKSNS